MAPGPPVGRPVEPAEPLLAAGTEARCGTHTCRRLQRETCLLFSHTHTHPSLFCPLLGSATRALCLGLARGRARLCKLENVT